MAEELFQTWSAFSKDTPLKRHAYKPRPLGDMDVEIKITHCGVCGSDIHTIDSGWGPTKYPCTVGHEIVGTVVAKGFSVTQHQLGACVGVGAQSRACWRADCYECSNGMDNNCPRQVGTYQSTFEDGFVSQGGYANRVRTDARHVFRIPPNLAPEHAAPLLCGGATVYSPLVRWGAGPGKVVGVVGIGGLGHLGVLFAKALGATTVAISSSAAKREDALKLGADEYISTGKGSKDFLKWQRKMDLLCITANANDIVSYSKYMSLLKARGTAIVVGAPEKPIELGAGLLIGGEKQIVGSAIGPVKVVQEMLELCAAKQIVPWVELFPLRDCNKAIEVVRNNTIRFRAVLTVDEARDFAEAPKL
ncbi:chaperonin 10-like protein [Hyaloraphidium curvatum]|nr:chaperonin 10-like protein [Hyaloraphidium curvatum]